MKNNIYTIGFTRKGAEKFFTLLRKNGIRTVLDIRLNNTSQLAAFAKFPDIKYFLKEICDIEYIHDIRFSPSSKILKRYRNKEIDWEQYILEFNSLMEERDINRHILEHYNLDRKICLLCSEVSSKNCHRSLIANRFKTIFGLADIVDL